MIEYFVLKYHVFESLDHNLANNIKPLKAI